MIFFILVISMILLPIPSFSATVMSENYDGITSNTNCGLNPPTTANGAQIDWIEWASPYSTPETYDGTQHYCGEILSNGRTGKSLTQWRHNGQSPGYCGFLDYLFTSAQFNNHYKALYFRWYMRYDVGFQITGEGHKFTRANFGASQGSRTYEIYLNASGSSLSNAHFMVTDSIDNHIYSDLTLSQLNLIDGNWHHVELYLQINSASGVSDGVVRMWVDGVQLYMNGTLGKTGIPYGLPTNVYYTSVITTGFGNFAAEAYWNFPTNTWYKAQWDDYVVSTTYVGPTGGSSDTNPPSPPRNLGIQQ